MDRPRWRFTLNYRIHHRIQAGIEFNPKAEEIGPLFTLFLLTETEKRPALFLGTSSDRIGSPSGKQSYYATISKYLPFLHASFYGSLNYSEWDDAVNGKYLLTVAYYVCSLPYSLKFHQVFRSNPKPTLHKLNVLRFL